MTSAKETVLSFGLMDAVISEDGAVVNKTAPALTSIKMERKGTESGKTAKKVQWVDGEAGGDDQF